MADWLPIGRPLCWQHYNALFQKQTSIFVYLCVFKQYFDISNNAQKCKLVLNYQVSSPCIVRAAGWLPHRAPQKLIPHFGVSFARPRATRGGEQSREGEMRKRAKSARGQNPMQKKARREIAAWSGPIWQNKALWRKIALECTKGQIHSLGEIANSVD